MQGQHIPASSSLPPLVPLFFFLSSSFHRQIHPSAFLSSSSSPPSSFEEGPPLNMGATGAEFGRTSETSLKRPLTVYLSYCCCCCFFLFIVFVIHLLYRLV